MSWHFLQEQEEACWEECFLDGAPSALLRLMPTHEQDCSTDSETECSTASQFGMTCEPSTGDRGADQSMSLAADFPVKTLVPQDQKLESKGRVPDSGAKWRGLLARFDPVTCLWKTAQHSLIEDSGSCLETWPAWGSTRGGECFQLAPLVLHTCDDDCSFWPTPRAAMAKSGFGNGRPQNNRYRKAVIDRCAQIGWSASPEMLEAVQGWPIGWTTPGVLEMDRFLEWLSEHGGC